MKNIFRHWSAFRRRLDQPSSTLWIFDFDGTLAPIARRPDQAVIPSNVRPLLKQFALAYPRRVGILSGRRLSDIRRKAGVKGLFYGGTHGFEMTGPTFRWTHALSPSRRRTFNAFVHDLQQSARRIKGLRAEFKKWSVCVHFRETDRQDRRKVAVFLNRIEAAAKKREYRTEHGLLTLEVFVYRGWNKGEAVRRLMTQLGAQRVLYIGDDTTDEAVFSAFQKPHMLIRVGYSRTSKAEFYLNSRSEIPSLLRKIMDATATTRSEKGNRKGFDLSG